MRWLVGYHHLWVNSHRPPLVQGLLGNPVLKAAVISSSMSVLGDVLAQLLTNRASQVRG